MERLDKYLIVSTGLALAVSLVLLLGADTFDNIAERQYILESDPCDLTNYIEEGNKEQARTFASFSFNYNNETENYDKEVVSFSISKELVPLAELRYHEECVKENED